MAEGVIFFEDSEREEMKTNPQKYFDKYKDNKIIWAGNPVLSVSPELFHQFLDSGMFVSCYFPGWTKDTHQFGRLLKNRDNKVNTGWWIDYTDPDVVELAARWLTSEVKEHGYNCISLDNFGLGSKVLSSRWPGREASYADGLLSFLDRLFELNAGIKIVVNHNIPIIGDETWLNLLMERPVTLMFEGDRFDYTRSHRAALNQIMQTHDAWVVHYTTDPEIDDQRKALMKTFCPNAIFSIETKERDKLEE